MVGWRNPARYIAPLALAAAITASYLIVHNAVVNKHSSTSTSTVQTTNTAVTHHGHSGAKVSTAKFYVVKPGDSLSGIAVKTGVSIATIEALNPSVSPNALQPAQRLRLRR